MNRPAHTALQLLIDERPVSRLQRIVQILCFLVVALDGFDSTVVGFLAPAITQEWEISPARFGPVFGSYAIGAMIGAFVFGPVADRIGRKSALIISTIIFSSACLASGFVASLGELVALRFISGLGLGGALPCATALTAEYFPRARRASVVTAMFCGFSLGAAAGGMIAAFATPLFGWRAVVIAGGLLPLLLVPLLYWLLPESLGFLLSRGSRGAEVARIMSLIAPDAAPDLVQSPSTTRHSAAPVTDLFRVRAIPATLMFWCCSFLTLLVIGMLSSWMPTLLSGQGYSLKDASLVTLMYQLGGVVGALVIGRCMDRFRPNRTLAIAFIVGSGCVVAIGLVSGSAILATVTMFLTGFFIIGAQFGIWAYAAAYYPLPVRATGLSWNSASGRGGAIAGSFLGGWLLLAGLGMTEILAWLALAIVGAAAMMFFHDRYPVPEGAE